MVWIQLSGLDSTRRFRNYQILVSNLNPDPKNNLFDELLSQTW